MENESGIGINCPEISRDSEKKLAHALGVQVARIFAVIAGSRHVELTVLSTSAQEEALTHYPVPC